MLSDDFCHKHDLCGYGSEQAQMQFGRDVKEVWFDRELEIGGTTLLWITSRAQYEKKALIRCCAECARETLKYIGAARAKAEESIQKVEGWCEGSVDREQIDTMIQDAFEHAKAAEDRPDGKPEHKAWLAIAALGRCIRSVTSCAGLGSVAAAAAEAAGESRVEMQKKLADIVRNRLPWEEVESTIRANKTSPKPRKKTPEETTAESQRLLSQYEELMNAYAAAQEQKDSLVAALGTSPDRIRSFMQSGRLGSKNQAVIDSQLAELEASDSASTEPPKQRAAPPRRPRMSV